MINSRDLPRQRQIQTLEQSEQAKAVLEKEKQELTLGSNYNFDRQVFEEALSRDGGVKTSCPQKLGQAGRPRVANFHL